MQNSSVRESLRIFLFEVIPSLFESIFVLLESRKPTIWNPVQFLSLRLIAEDQLE